MKVVLLLVALILILGSFSFECHQPSRLVYLSCFDKGQYKFGSGIWLDDQYILTAEHVIEKSRKISLCTDPKSCGSPNYCSVVASGKDFAILKSPIKSNFPALTFSHRLEYGQPVYFWSYYSSVRKKTGERTPVFNTGTIATQEFESTGMQLFLVNGLLLHGASGSGVFDNEGNLLGVIRGYWGDATCSDEKLNWYVSVTTTQRIEEAYNKIRTH